MIHRHINDSEWSVAAIDSCLLHGSLDDWCELMLAAQKDTEILARIAQLTTNRRQDDEEAAIYAWWADHLHEAQALVRKDLGNARRALGWVDE